MRHSVQDDERMTGVIGPMNGYGYSYGSPAALDGYTEMQVKAAYEYLSPRLDGLDVQRDAYVSGPESTYIRLHAAHEQNTGRAAVPRSLPVHDDAQEAVLSEPPRAAIVTSPRSNKRSNRVSLAGLSLYNIHEPEQDTGALELDLHGEQESSSRNSWCNSYTRSTESPSSAVPSLVYSSNTSSTGYSTPAAPVEYIKEKKEKRIGKALLGKLKSLLGPVSPASAEREIKDTSKPRRRRGRTPPAIEERSTSLYRADADPLNLARDRRASTFCSGPYGNLAAYTSAFQSTASVSPQRQAFASVADFRHYSTAELAFDASFPYSPYAAQETARSSIFFEPALAPAPASTPVRSDLALGTDKVKLKQKGADWATKSKQFWSSALDLSLRSNRHTMSTVELASPQPVRPNTGLVPAPPIPARSRLRSSPTGNKREQSRATPPMSSSPSASSLGSASAQCGDSPGLPTTPGTPPVAPVAQRVTDYGFGEHTAGPSVWPGKLETAQTSPMGSVAERKRSRFSRGRQSSSGSVSLSASSDPLRVKDGVAPRGSTSGLYTPPTFPGPSRPSMHSSCSSVSMTAPSRSASGSSDISDSSVYSIPQTPTSPSNAAAASRVYTACVGALSSWSISGKRASQPKPISAPMHSPVHAPMSASAAYFPAPSSYGSRHQASRGASYSSTASDGPVQVWTPEQGWAPAAGLGVGVEEEGNYVQGRSRSSTLGPAVIMADAPKGRRKPVPRPDEVVHAM